MSPREIAQASRSPVFAKMFDTDMLEKTTGVLRIDDARLAVVHAMIKFCYTAEIEFSDNLSSEEVLEVAHKYDIDLLKTTCERHLVATLSHENLPRRLKLARKFESDALQTATTQYLKNNFDALFCSVLEELC